MKKKTKIIISCIVAAVLILGFVIWVIMPRVALSKMVEEFIFPDFENCKGEYFDEYDVRNDSFVRTENEYIAFDIPSGYVLEKQPTEENDHIPYIYSQDDTKEYVLMFAKPDDTVLDLTDHSMYEDDENIPDEKTFQKMVDAFESFGNGIPDSRFAAYKCIALLDKEDYSFWDIGKATAFTVLGTFKVTAFSHYDNIYVYESEDINGILYITDNSDDPDDFTKYEAIFDAYPVSDLNHSYTILMDMNSLEDIYSVINSVEFKMEG